MEKGRYYRKGERAAARPFHPEVGTRQNMCSIEPKDGAFYFKDEVSEHGLVLLVQLN